MAFGIGEAVEGRGTRGPAFPPSNSGVSRAWAAAALAVVLAGAAAWLSRPRTPTRFFPRGRAEAPAPAELSRVLAEAGRRLAADPEDLGALVDSGIARAMQGREQNIDAINLLEQARKLGALDDRVFYHLGLLYQEEGLPHVAIPEFQRFVRNHPDDVDARMLLAKLLYQAGRHEAAAAHYARLAGANPEVPLALEHLGLCRRELGRKEEAAKAFAELVSRGGDDGRRAHFHLGQLAAADKDFAAAKDHFTAMGPVDPALGLPPEAVHAAMAAVYESLKAPKLAKEHWEAVLRSTPRDAKAKAALRAVDAQLQREAREAARRAREAERKQREAERKAKSAATKKSR